MVSDFERNDDGTYTVRVNVRQEDRRTPEGDWIKVRRDGDAFEVIDDNMTAKDGDDLFDPTALGFGPWSAEVTDEDGGRSDESQCFGMSADLRWNEVRLTPGRITAPSVERLFEALKHVAVFAWCPGDI